jgi:class 3 adenylate cyclase
MHPELLRLLADERLAERRRTARASDTAHALPAGPLIVTRIDRGGLAAVPLVVDNPAPQRALAPSGRVLATILFTDLVSSTSQAVRLGDQAWIDLLRKHHAAVRGRLAEYGGEELDVAGDGFFAAFDAPGRAIECARAIRNDLEELGLQVRAGIHSGECERIDGKLSGIAVHLGARIAAEAEVGDIFVSRTVRDLVAGSGLAFEDRGVRRLKGMPEAWRLFAVAGPQPRELADGSARMSAAPLGRPTPSWRLASAVHTWLRSLAPIAGAGIADVWAT